MAQHPYPKPETIPTEEKFVAEEDKPENNLFKDLRDIDQFIGKPKGDL